MISHEAMLDALLKPGSPIGEHRFGHLEHVGVALESHLRFGPRSAELILRAALASLADRLGVPEMYHETLTMFWSGFVGHACDVAPAATSLDQLTAAVPMLLATEAPSRHWSPGVLWSDEARAGWVDPDVAPLPWRDSPSHTEELMK